MWILNNLWIFPAIALGVTLVFIAYRMYKNKKAGNTSCGCGCSGCAMRDKCHPTEKN